ncbi:MAG TPA: hypothetical protein VEH06_05305, partial [Candidatus Bathyarchaeia archaeon]|nr:hypothetical protein [Candidatus Bathyarchaeia archaeon]
MSSQAYQNNNSNTHYNIINFEHKRNTRETTMLSPPNSSQLPAMVSKSLSSSSTPTVRTASSSGSSATTLRTKVSEPPAFEKGIANEISANFGQIVQVIFIKPLRIKIAVEPHNIIKVATFLRDKFGFDHAESVAGTDYPKE